MTGRDNRDRRLAAMREWSPRSRDQHTRILHLNIKIIGQRSFVAPLLLEMSSCLSTAALDIANAIFILDLKHELKLVLACNHQHHRWSFKNVYGCHILMMPLDRLGRLLHLDFRNAGSWSGSNASSYDAVSHANAVHIEICSRTERKRIQETCHTQII